MARVLASLALFGLNGRAASDDAVSVAGVQKVIQMLTDITAKAKQEKQDEEIAFAKFETWCGQEIPNLQAYIAKNGQDIELLTANIGKLKSEAKTLGEEIGKLNDDITRLKADEAAQRDQRAKDHAEFLAEEKDFSESVDALERAIRTLQKKSQDVPGTKAALLQMSDEGRLPAKAQSIVATFLGLLSENSDAPDFASYQAPVADAYEFQSSGIIDMLKKLLDDFRAQLAQTQKGEMNSKHAFDLIITDIEGSTKNAEKQVAEKTSEKLAREQQAALDQKQLAAIKNQKAENEKTLKDTEIECRQKKMSFQEKQHLRAEELEALGKALEIISSPDVLGNSQKHLALAQANGAVLLQVGRRAETEGFRGQLRDFLASEGRRLHSQSLALLSQRAGQDPFGKIKQMISDMIAKLYQESEEDAKHEGWCDAEMGKSQITRARLSERIEKLTAAVESGKANIQSLAEAIASLTQEAADLQAALASAAELRAEEKAQNLETIKDAKTALAAVERATGVLKDFYNKALTATALVQVKAAPERAFGLKSTIKMGSDEWKALANPKYSGSRDTGHKEGMQTFGDVYQGKQDEINNGVLALMEVIASDFANLRSDTEASEAAAQRAYEEFVRESKKNLAVKGKNIELNSADKASAEVKLQEDTKDLKGTEDELLAAERYHEQLEPQCIKQPASYEETAKARQEELASLKQALEMLGSMNA